MLYLAYGNGAGPNDVTSRGGLQNSIRATEPGPTSPLKRAIWLRRPEHRSQHRGTLAVTTIDRWDVVDTIFRTTDGGRTWKSAAPNRSALVGISLRHLWPARAQIGCGPDALAIDPFDSNHVCYGHRRHHLGNRRSQTSIRAGRRIGGVGRGIEETAVIDLISPPQRGASGQAHWVTSGGFRPQ